MPQTGFEKLLQTFCKNEMSDKKIRVGKYSSQKLGRVAEPETRYFFLWSKDYSLPIWHYISYIIAPKANVKTNSPSVQHTKEPEIQQISVVNQNDNHKIG
jgi:hypothetical protein